MSMVADACEMIIKKLEMTDGSSSEEIKNYIWENEATINENAVKNALYKMKKNQDIVLVHGKYYLNEDKRKLDDDNLFEQLDVLIESIKKFKWYNATDDERRKYELYCTNLKRIKNKLNNMFD